MSTMMVSPVVLVNRLWRVLLALKRSRHLAAKVMAFCSTKLMSPLVTSMPDLFTRPAVLLVTQSSRFSWVIAPVSIGTSHPAIVSRYAGLMGTSGAARSRATAAITGMSWGVVAGGPAHGCHIVHAGCNCFGSILVVPLAAPSAMTPAAAAAPTGLTTVLGFTGRLSDPAVVLGLPSRENPMVMRSDWSPSMGVKSPLRASSASAMGGSGGSGVLVGVGKLEDGVMAVVVVVGVLELVQATRPGVSANRAKNRRRFMVLA